MSDLIHIISWERYCERDNNNDLEKYMELPLQNYPGLLDIRNLNLKNSGPLLKDLPDNCLNVLTCRLRVLVENETFIDSPNRIVSLTKLLCLIARNGKNFSKLGENLAPNLMVQLIEMSLHQLSNAMNNEWLNILEYSLYFLEIIYDPTFSWRRRKKLFYSELAETELAVAFNPTSTKSLQISVETATWLCSQLIIYFNDRDIRTRLMYLLCAIASGAKDNAQFIISPATVDAFKFDTDSNVNIETIVSYCCLIYCLSEIPIAERQEELPIVVKKLLDYVTSKSEIRISELRCLYQLILVSYELSAELIRCGILNVIKICLTNTKQDPEQCSFCFLLLSKLTSGKFQAQNQFIESKGYNELFNYLTSNPLQAAFLLDLIFTWAVAEPFDASKIMNKKYVIRDGNVIGLLIRWATSLSFVYENETEISNEKNSPNRCPPAVVNWKAIFKLIVELCHKSRCSISRSCECGVIVVITECIQQACRHIDTCIPEVINHDDEILCKKISTIQRKGDELLKGLFHMMEIFCSYSIQGRDLKAVMSLFKDNYTRTRSRKLIKIFIKVISEREDEIKCWFELSQPGDCISIAPAGNQAEFSMKNNINNYHLDRRLSPQAILDAITWKISSSGFSFHCWLNISPLSVLEKVDAGHERSSLFRLLTDNNNGFEAFLNMDDQLIVATCHQGEFQYVQICNNSRKRTAFMLEESLLKSDKWHLLDIVYQSAKNFFSKPCVMVYVNGALVDTVELKYPFINENISIFHIGGCPKNLQIPTKNLVDPKVKRKSLFMSNSSVKKTFLFEEHNTWGRLSTLKCRIAAVACINDVLPETTITTLFQKGPLDTQAVVNDETLLGNILINYHARAFDCTDNLCFNLHAYIQSSRSNKYHSGYLIGEWLQRHKFEDVINEIGGLSCLLPIFEQLEFLYFQTDSDLDQEYNDGYHFAEFYSSRESSRNSPSSVENVGFITVPDKFTDAKLNEGMLARLVILIRRLMSFEINQQQMENMKFIHIVGALMQKVDIIFLDKNAIMAFRSLADLSSSNLSSQIYKFILLDWRIWSRCSDEIRQQHCLFVLDIVKSDRAMFRQQYGISLLLDALHFHHRPLLINQEDLHKKLRDYIYAMIFHLIHKHVTILDYQKILKFLHETNDDILIQEGLELLLKLYTSSDSGHQDSLLLYENNLMESLFVLLIKNLSVQTKEDAIKFLHLIITSTRTADKFKSHLLLNEISFASIFTFTEFCQAPLSAVSIQNLLEIIRKASSKDLFGVIQFLSLLTLSPIKQRISAIKMLKSIFDKSPEAILEISKQPGWQDILIHLLVLNKKEEKESVSSLNENDKMEDINMRSKDINGDVKGFRRSSTLLFEESSNDCISVSTSKFDNLLEEDEEEYRLIEQLAENADTDENMENKSLDTVFIRQMASSVCEISYEESSLNLSMPHFHRRSICTSVTSSDDISQQLKIGNGLSDNYEKESIVTDIVTLKDELIDLVLDCLNKVMWKVLSSSNDKDSWMVVHQVIESLRSVNERYTLLNEIFYFKERILMGILNSFIDLYKPSDSSINRLTMHSKELIYLIVDNSCHNLGCDGSEHKIQLLDQTMIFMQECLQVWEEDNLRPELAALGFYYLLSTLGCDGNRGIVSAVCARLHQIITSISKNINYEEIAFIIVHLDQVLKHMISSDNYYSVALILKSLLEYYGEVLQISTYLPNMSTKTVEFFDDFKNYSNSEEWQNFIKLRLTSACEIYETNYLNEMTTGQSLWRAQANERMSLDRRVRLSLSKDHRKRFENEIINMTTKWIKDERKRRNCVEKDLRMQHEATLRLWRVIKQYLTGIKGCWDDKLNMQQLYWKQSCRENYLRMRPRFEPNYQYDQHLDASKERDFPSHSYKETEPNPLLYLSALEGKIDFFALGDDQLGDDEWITVQNTGLTNSISGSIQNPSSGLSVKKTMILECRCKLIKFTEVIEGKFELTNTHFIFNGINFSIDALDSSTSHMVHSINQIKEIHLRRYNLRRSAIEIFLIDQTNYFFNFTTKTRNKVYSKILSMRPQSLIYSKPRSPADLLKSSNLTQKWITREISNFEYLMQLNTIAGRTYNDMSQYPVFPWILSDYTSPKLDLENPKTFRDLSKPIGVVNPKNEPEIREKYDGFEDPTGVVAQFHYGTHYSSAAGVMHYMVRVEPFTSMHIQLQSGKFDVADRQFHSIPLAWNFIMESPSDNKELIPEFFYEPDFLRNQNNFEFGLLQQNKTPIDDVELPAWASSPEDFIYQHQQALESEYVSQNLHHWIDLIFGYKQKGPEAVKALNVFYYVTYEGVVDLDQISDPIERESIESMINNFGQTPCQLFKVPHPRRLTEAEEKNLTIKVDKYLPVLSNILSLKHTSKSVCSSSEPIVFVRVPVTQTKGFIGTDRSLTMVTVHSSNIVAKHNWMPNYRNAGLNFHIDIDTVLDNLNTRRKNFLGPLSSFVDISNRIYDVSPDCKYIIAGGNIENRLTIMSLKKPEIYNVPTPHHLPVSCVSIDIDCASPGTSFNGSLTGVGGTSTLAVRLFAITGSLDSTCAVWNLSDLPSTSLIQTLCGHSGPVTSVSLSMFLDVALTGSEDGTVNLHSVIRGQFLHSITPGFLNSATLSINFVVLTRSGQIYIQWQNGLTPSKDKSKSSSASCSANHPKQFLSVYSLHANHISTCELGHSKVTALSVVPKCLGSLNHCCLIGNVKGELVILDGYYLTDQKTLNFQNSILDVQLLSPNGQHLVVALSNGCLIISTVSLSNIDKQ